MRRAQEAFELYLKGVFRFLQAEYPTLHDVKKEIYALTKTFKQHRLESQIQTRQVARLVLANSMLHLWRLPAFYGDETLNVGLFEESEAKLALSYADSAQFVCSVVRFNVYQLPARVSRHIRDAERSAPFCATAEDEYDDGLQALIDGNCAQGIQYLRASDSALQQSPDSEFFMSPEETR